MAHIDTSLIPEAKVSYVCTSCGNELPPQYLTFDGLFFCNTKCQTEYLKDYLKEEEKEFNSDSY